MLALLNKRRVPTTVTGKMAAERKFDWAGKTPTWEPVGGVGAFETEAQKKRLVGAELFTMLNEVSGNEAEFDLQAALREELAKRLARERVNDVKHEMDAEYEDAFKRWMAGTHVELNHPKVSPMGYRNLAEFFPAATNWAEQQLHVQTLIRNYLIRLYLSFPQTHTEVEHYFRYLCWPVMRAIRAVQQVNPNAPKDMIQVSKMKVSEWANAKDSKAMFADAKVEIPPDTCWLQNSAVTFDGRVVWWPASLTYHGRGPKPDIPLALDPAINPYMRDAFFTSTVTYKEWIKGDFSHLRDDARELWEMAALQISGRDDQMVPPLEREPLFDDPDRDARMKETRRRRRDDGPGSGGADTDRKNDDDDDDDDDDDENNNDRKSQGNTSPDLSRDKPQTIIQNALDMIGGVFQGILSRNGSAPVEEVVLNEVDDYTPDVPGVIAENQQEQELNADENLSEDVAAAVVESESDEPPPLADIPVDDDIEDASGETVAVEPDPDAIDANSNDENPPSVVDNALDDLKKAHGNTLTFKKIRDFVKARDSATRAKLAAALGVRSNISGASQLSSIASKMEGRLENEVIPAEVMWVHVGSVW